MKFDYFYEEQSENYVFYRTPKVLCTDEPFRQLSSDAKLLYGILLDRIQLSKKNHWIDENGRVFVYMTISSIEYAIGRCHQKSCKVLDELDKIGLIERCKQGQGKPTRIYVKNFGAVWDSYSQKYVNHTQGSMPFIPQEVCESYSNNTEINNTDFNNINPILSGTSVDNPIRIYSDKDTDKDERENYREYLYDRLDMAILYENYPFDRETIDAILELMLDTICSKRKTIRIAGDDKPVSVVKSQFLKLNSMHIEYVMDCMKKNGSKVRNIKQYLLAALYNAPLTMQSYYQAWVNNDMAEGRI